jgi:adenosine/AMP kinase
MARTVPNILTLVDDANPLNVRTLVIAEGMGKLVVSATEGSKKITVELDEDQAKRLRGKIDKFFRDNR